MDCPYLVNGACAFFYGRTLPCTDPDSCVRLTHLKRLPEEARGLILSGRAAFHARLDAKQAEKAPEDKEICKYRGATLTEGSCKCHAGRVYACAHPTFQNRDGTPGPVSGRQCGKTACKGYTIDA